MITISLQPTVGVQPAGSARGCASSLPAGVSAPLAGRYRRFRDGLRGGARTAAARRSQRCPKGFVMKWGFSPGGYANVTATMALIASPGGHELCGDQAAQGQRGRQQIRADAVSSSKVKDA